MKKSGRVLLSLSVISLFSLFICCPNARSGAGSKALDAVISGGIAGLGQPADYKIVKKTPHVTPAVAARVPELAAAMKPGKDLLPIVKDEVRVKAILQLISDIYYGKQLPFSQDGVTFLNKEGRLPPQPQGFYKEYTLITGSAPHTVVIGGTTYQVSPDLGVRGSERVVIGNGEKLYYTPDHYGIFILLSVVR